MKRTAVRLGVIVLAGWVLSTARADLVAYYTFDNASNLSENTGSATTLDWSGASGVTQVAGLFGGAGAFNDTTSDYWDDDFNKAGVALSSFSISMHVKGTTANWKDYLSFGVGGGVMFFEQSSSTSVSVWDNDGGLPGGPINIQGTTTVNNGSWHQLGLVSGGGTLTLYIDGAFQGSQAYTGTGTISSFQIGDRWFGGRDVVANIDDVAVFNTALTADDMLFLSTHAASTIPEPSTVGVMLAVAGAAVFRRRLKRKN